MAPPVREIPGPGRGLRDAPCICVLIQPGKIGTAWPDRNPTRLSARPLTVAEYQ